MVRSHALLPVEPPHCQEQGLHTARGGAPLAARQFGDAVGKGRCRECVDRLAAEGVESVAMEGPRGHGVLPCELLEAHGNEAVLVNVRIPAFIGQGTVPRLGLVSPPCMVEGTTNFWDLVQLVEKPLHAVTDGARSRGMGRS